MKGLIKNMRQTLDKQKVKVKATKPKDHIRPSLTKIYHIKVII